MLDCLEPPTTSLVDALYPTVWISKVHNFLDFAQASLETPRSKAECLGTHLACLQDLVQVENPVPHSDPTVVSAML